MGLELRDKYGQPLDNGFYEGTDNNLLFINVEGGRYYVSSPTNRTKREIIEEEVPQGNPDCNIFRTCPHDFLERRIRENEEEIRILQEFINSRSGGGS